MTQLKEQQNSIGKTLPSLLKSNIKIFDASLYDKRLKVFKSNKDINEVTKVIGVWSAYLGYAISEGELKLINIAIRKSFPNLTLEDLKQVVHMIGSFEITTKYHGVFAMLYIGQVLHEYKRFKGKTIINITDKLKALKNLESLPKPSIEQSLEIQKSIFKTAQKEAIKGIFFDSGNLVYNYIVKHRLIIFIDELIFEAEAYAKRKSDSKFKASVIQAVINKTVLKKRDSKYKIQMLKREYVVNNWLRSYNPKEFKIFLQNLKYE